MNEQTNQWKKQLLEKLENTEIQPISANELGAKHFYTHLATRTKNHPRELSEYTGYLKAYSSLDYKPNATFIDEITGDRLTIRFNKKQQFKVANLIEKYVRIKGVTRLDPKTREPVEMVELLEIKLAPPRPNPNPEKLAALYGSAKNLLPADKTSVELIGETREEIWG